MYQNINGPTCDDVMVSGISSRYNNMTRHAKLQEVEYADDGTLSLYELQ